MGFTLYCWSKFNHELKCPWHRKYIHEAWWEGLTVTWFGNRKHPKLSDLTIGPSQLSLSRHEMFEISREFLGFRSPEVDSHLRHVAPRLRVIGARPSAITKWCLLQGWKCPFSTTVISKRRALFTPWRSATSHLKGDVTWNFFSNR